MNQYDNLIKNKDNLPFDLCFHFYINLLFAALTFIFSVCFIILKKDKFLYIITEISFIAIKILLYIRFIFLKRRKMPKIDDIKSDE